jgi:hypothetical protein
MHAVVRTYKSEPTLPTDERRKFLYQEMWGIIDKGYAALSYSLRDKKMIVNYIINQQEHHKKESFKDEYMTFIREMGKEFDERDWDR